MLLLFDMTPHSQIRTTHNQSSQHRLYVPLHVDANHCYHVHFLRHSVSLVDLGIGVVFAYARFGERTL